MRKDPMEMAIEELDAAFGRPQFLATITHILSCGENVHHDRFTVEAVTEDTRHISIQFSQSALRTLVQMVEASLRADRPKAN